MKTNRFLVAAGISLALAFTISCSSDDSGNDDKGGGGGDNGGGSFNANSQIFRYDGSIYASAFTAYTGDGIVEMNLYGDEGDTLINVGSVTGGFVNLDSPLPTPPDKYLDFLNEDFKAAGCNVSASDVKYSNCILYFYDRDGLFSDKNNFNPTYRDSTTWEVAKYRYFTKDVNIICNTRENGVSSSWNMKLKAGWNIVYEIQKRDPSTRELIEVKISTDNIITKELKWMLY